LLRHEGMELGWRELFWSWSGDWGCGKKVIDKLRWSELEGKAP
ncbi:hypothetical protein SAMN04488516_1141, partial [Desulfonauticus submarinus]